MNTHFNHHFLNKQVNAEAIMLLADSMASAAASFNTQNGYDQFIQSRNQLGQVLESLFTVNIVKNKMDS